MTIYNDLGPEAGFKDYVRFRTKQGFNCFAMIAALPNWANDGKPNRLKAPDGTVVRSAWQQPGTKSAKDMHDEDANKVIEKYGPPPFGTLAGTNSNPSSLRNFGHIDKAKWLTFHQIGNSPRTHDSYEMLTKIPAAYSKQTIGPAQRIRQAQRFHRLGLLRKHSRERPLPAPVSDTD